MIKKSGLQLQNRKKVKKGILSPLILKPTKSGLLSAIGTRPKTKQKTQSTKKKPLSLRIPKISRSGISSENNNKKPNVQNQKKSLPKYYKPKPIVKPKPKPIVKPKPKPIIKPTPRPQIQQRYIPVSYTHLTLPTTPYV